MFNGLRGNTYFLRIMLEVSQQKVALILSSLTTLTNQYVLVLDPLKDLIPPLPPCAQNNGGLSRGKGQHNNVNRNKNKQ